MQRDEQDRTPQLPAPEAIAIGSAKPPLLPFTLTTETSTVPPGERAGRPSKSIQQDWSHWRLFHKDLEARVLKTRGEHDQMR